MSRLPRIGLVLLLAGCTTGLHPLNPGADTGAADDTGPVPQDTDTDPQPTGSAPTLTTFEGSMSGSAVVVLFSASDPDGDLEGGHLELTVDGSSQLLAIPGDLDSWTGSSGTVSLPASSGGCGGATYSLRGRVVDATGLESAEGSDSVSAGASNGITATEVGDTTSDVDPLGTLDPPLQICGDAWGAGNDGASYTYDYDLMSFQPGTTGLWTFELTWAESGDDYDLRLWDAAGQPLDQAETDGPTQPEVIADMYVFAGETLYLDVGAWSGSGGSWTIAIY